MPRGMISIDFSGFKQLQKALSEFPREHKRACYRLVNDQAFAYKKFGPPEIDTFSIIRQPGFVSSAFQVEKAKSARSIEDIQAAAGTMGPEAGGRFSAFSGWAELIDSSIKPPRSDRVIGPAARGGSMSGNVKKSARLIPGKQFPNSRNFSGPSVKPGKRNVQFMASLAKKHYRGAFVLESESGKHAGLYTFSDDWGAEGTYIFPKPIRLQSFGKEIKAKHIDWNESILLKVRAEFTSQKIFDSYIMPALKKAQERSKK
ncbi:hypothetical protein LQZ19_05245 [Treponema primitia]|uniref:hypothetical protein n=1 Tax=Treponema primitia TaxID=88058 RepID=UPI00397FCF98